MMRFFAIFLFAISFGISASAQLSDTLNQTDNMGKKQGYWIKHNEAGMKIYEGRFVDDTPMGEFKYYYPDGETKAISVFSDNGTYTKTTTFHLSGKTMAEGFYHNKQKDSTWVFYDSQGVMLKKEFYRDDVKEGIWITYYPNGEKSEEVSWKDNKENGPWRKYYSNGILQTEGTYVNGEKSGKIDFYFDNGRLSISGFYHNSLRDGEWIYLGPKSNIVKKETYDKGKLIQSEEFDTEDTQN